MNVTERKKMVSHRLVDLGLTKAEVARQVGVTASYVTNVLNGRIVPSATVGTAIAEVLKLKPQAIWPDLVI